MVVLPKHPKMIIFSMKTPWLLGKPPILGNPHISYASPEFQKPPRFFSAASHPEAQSPNSAWSTELREFSMLERGAAWKSRIFWKIWEFHSWSWSCHGWQLYRGISSQIHPSIHSFIHSFIYSFIHSFIHSFIRSSIHSFIHAINPSLPSIHPIPFHAMPSIHQEANQFISNLRSSYPPDSL